MVNTSFPELFSAHKKLTRRLVTGLFCLLGTVSILAQTPKHPLDALSVQEHWTAFQVLRAAGKVDTETRFPMIQLKEPPKQEVLAWKPGQPVRREAFIVVKQGPRATPISIQQPMGPSYHLDGQSVSWQKWQFHFRLDRRLGLILNNVAYRDGDNLRSILYEASLSEIFVPYMDPGEHWFDKNFFDASNDGSAFSSTMEVGVDCPENATYFDEAYADWKGTPRLKPRSVCLFEQPSGMAWRHDQDGLLQSRRARELVLRTIGMFGNYDYVFDWIFAQTGTIRVRVGATGADQTKSVRVRSAAEDPTGEASTYGRFIADGTVAVDHDHFFAFRLDFDIDGTANSFVRDKLQLKRLPQDSVRKSLWVAVPETAKNEEQAKSHMSMEHPENWRVVNPSVKNYLGHPVGYEIMGGENAMSLLLTDDFPQKRAGFVDYQVWVTPYRENERYAAGDYPMQSRGGEGLPAWTKANRPIENTDIVLWYTMGFHHVPSSEDWPILPTVWHEFELKPVNFFAHNPALDLPN